MLQRLIPATMTVLMTDLLKITLLTALIMAKTHANSSIEEKLRYYSHIDERQNMKPVMPFL
jgi:hypothetical protein